MSARRFVSIAATCVVALVMMLALPVAQLAVAGPAGPVCCCPHPEQCRCPDHHPSRVTPETVRSCHGDTAASTAQRLPVFAVPPASRLDAPARAIAFVAIPLAAPHVPPTLDRRAAPS